MTFSLWPHDFFIFLHNVVEGPCDALFITSFVLTLAVTKQMAARSKNHFLGTAQFVLTKAMSQSVTIWCSINVAPYIGCEMGA